MQKMNKKSNGRGAKRVNQDADCYMKPSAQSLSRLCNCRNILILSMMPHHNDNNGQIEMCDFHK